eukprot:2604779-Rhodomonas_salina.1
MPGTDIAYAAMYLRGCPVRKYRMALSVYAIDGTNMTYGASIYRDCHSVSYLVVPLLPLLLCHDG